VAYDLLGDAEKRARFDRGESMLRTERPRERFYRDFHGADGTAHLQHSGGFADS